MALKKQPMLVTWKNIAPPYPDYHFFVQAEQYPFKPAAKSYELGNAWWLIEAATLAYSEEDFARERFRMAGLPEVRYFNKTSTQCYVASNHDFALVAFRGTESRRRAGHNDFTNIIVDLKVDLKIKLVASGGQGRVHEGFNSALDEVWEELKIYLDGLEHAGRKIWITGHSLGAAIAILAAYRYSKTQGLYVFGSPRVGDQDFRDDFRIPAYRFENNNDIVCKVPPSPPYQHVGVSKYIDRKGIIQENVTVPVLSTDALQGLFANVNNWLADQERSIAGLVPDWLKDHAPVLYAVHIWNNLV